MEGLKARLRKLRTDANMTQEELAKKLFVVRGTVASYENTRRRPSLEVIVGYSELFNVSTDYILKGGLKDGMG